MWFIWRSVCLLFTSRSADATRAERTEVHLRSSAEGTQPQKKGQVSVFCSRRCLSVPVCARAVVFFVCGVFTCGSLYVQSLLSAGKLSFEALFNTRGKKLSRLTPLSGSAQTCGVGLGKRFAENCVLECSCCLLNVPENAKPLRLA